MVKYLSDDAYHSDENVAESSLAGLGGIQKCIGEKAFSAFLPTNITNDATKMAKVGSIQ
jgi:hypothetical protein